MERAIQYELSNETVHILASSRSFGWLIHVVCPSQGYEAKIRTFGTTLALRGARNKWIIVLVH